MRKPFTIKKLFFQIVLIYPILSFSQVKSDNNLKTRLDSLVDKSVQTYYKDVKAVGLSIGIVLNGKTISTITARSKTEKQFCHLKIRSTN